MDTMPGEAHGDLRARAWDRRRGPAATTRETARASVAVPCRIGAGSPADRARRRCRCGSDSRCARTPCRRGRAARLDRRPPRSSAARREAGGVGADAAARSARAPGAVGRRRPGRRSRSRSSSPGARRRRRWSNRATTRVPARRGRTSTIRARSSAARSPARGGRWMTRWWVAWTLSGAARLAGRSCVAQRDGRPATRSRRRRADGRRARRRQGVEVARVVLAERRRVGHEPAGVDEVLRAPTSVPTIGAGMRSRRAHHGRGKFMQSTKICSKSGWAASETCSIRPAISSARARSASESRQSWAPSEAALPT